MPGWGEIGQALAFGENRWLVGECSSLTLMPGWGEIGQALAFGENRR